MTDFESKSEFIENVNESGTSNELIYERNSFSISKAIFNEKKVF
jgi:hypothetical protein